jgi:hypothetical protein
MRKPHIDEFARHLNRRLRETQPGHILEDEDTVAESRGA